jgi:hypothetical protein
MAAKMAAAAQRRSGIMPGWRNTAAASKKRQWPGGIRRWASGVASMARNVARKQQRQ